MPLHSVSFTLSLNAKSIDHDINEKHSLLTELNEASIYLLHKTIKYHKKLQLIWNKVRGERRTTTTSTKSEETLKIDVFFPWSSFTTVE